ncbi:HNH endonuclease [Bradyrhizobium sp. LA7.1]|uniref:HNH endonuclease n=1 Tax=Bradyrhizobium sp. LA7.1 TaxID=3156324 RepID=UPI003398328D
MSLDPAILARQISDECGLTFEGRTAAAGKDRAIELYPAGVPLQHTFAIRTVIGWRHVEVAFIAGSYAADFIAHMGLADEAGRKGCAAVLGKCVDDGATVTLRINGESRSPRDPSQWGDDWSRFELSLRRGQLELGNGDSDNSKISAWTQQAAAAVISLLPLEEDDTSTENLQGGFPEGAKQRVEVNRYERDRRNRAAALAIHGYVCKACDSDLSSVYGAAAAGLIEIHHLTPVSRLGEGYCLDPASDLVPLCPNCHRVAHRRDPPFTPAELRAMVSAK